jgi:hypothetical protein
MIKGIVITNYDGTTRLLLNGEDRLISVSYEARAFGASGHPLEDQEDNFNAILIETALVLILLAIFFCYLKMKL